MARCINADALAKRIDEGLCKPCRDDKHDYNGVRCRACWVDDMLIWIDSEPTADVRENVHGEWRKVYPTYELNIIARKHEPCYVCSKCNAHVDVKTPFCPICDSYMRGVE